MAKLIPTRWHVIVKDLGNVRRIRRVILPDGTNREFDARFGEVVAVGAECFTGNYSCFKPITAGSLIAYGQKAGARMPFTWEHEQLTAILDEDVLALIVDDVEREVREELNDANDANIDVGKG